MKCPHCQKEIDENEKIAIHGTAHVNGFTSLKDFRDHGIVWTTHDSWNEEAKCPHCRRFFKL